MTKRLRAPPLLIRYLKEIYVYEDHYHGLEKSYLGITFLKLLITTN